MAIRPIIFSAPMVLALLAGRKTQTRRVHKPQPKFGFKPWQDDGIWKQSGYGEAGDDFLAVPYAPGDLLYVREAAYFAPNRVAYAAANGELAKGERVEGFGRLKPSIHMPRWASRLTLAVTDVRVQRLNEISKGDAMAEGVAATEFWSAAVSNTDSRWEPARIAFRLLWNSLHGPDAWLLNPWVVAVTFDVHKANVDQFVEANKKVAAE
jgi:hypothetical protein